MLELALDAEVDHRLDRVQRRIDHAALEQLVGLRAGAGDRHRAEVLEQALLDRAAHAHLLVLEVVGLDDVLAAVVDLAAAEEADAEQGCELRGIGAVQFARQRPGQTDDRGHQRKPEYRAHLGLSGAAELAQADVGEAGERARTQPGDCPEPLVGLQRGAQQHDHAGKAHHHRARGDPAQALAEEQRQQQGDEERRGVVERDRGGERQHPDREEIAHQCRGAGEAAREVHPPVRRAERDALAQRERSHHRHAHDAAPEDDLPGGKRARRQLHAHAHAGEQEAGDDHPEGGHGGCCAATKGLH